MERPRIFIKLISELPDDFSGLIIGPYKSAKKKYFNRLSNLIENYNIRNRVFSMMQKMILEKYTIYQI